jgi:undecaprenyl-diphosphatase
VFELLQAIVLGLLQGLTEFLPVSSSGHLQGVPYLLGWDTGSLTFDVLLHTATLVAIVAYFREDLTALAGAAFGRAGYGPTDRRDAWLMIALLALGTVPAAVAGIAFGDVFEAAFDSPRMVAGFLYLTAVILWVSERIRRYRLTRPQTAADSAATPLEPAHGLLARLEHRGDHPSAPPPSPPADAAEVTSDTAGAADDGGSLGRPLANLRVRDAVAIGAAQALAIFPGISRSGATIAMGMSVGLSRNAAARFSFLLAIPIILGATLVTLPDVGTTTPGTIDFGPGAIVAGMVAAGVSGYWAIATLLAVVQRRDLLGFARYVVVFATVLLVATFVRG